MDLGVHDQLCKALPGMLSEVCLSRKPARGHAAAAQAGEGALYHGSHPPGVQRALRPFVPCGRMMKVYRV